MHDSLRVRLFDQNAQLGYLYDLKRNSVINMSILNVNPISNGLINKIDLNQTNYHYTSNDSYCEKFKLLKVDAYLKLEVLMGLFKFNSYSSYLNEFKQSNRSKKYTYLLEIKKVHDILDINQKKYINLNALNNVEATHVIVGIHWGGSIVSSFELDELDYKEIEEKEGFLGNTLAKLKDFFEFRQNLDKHKYTNLKLFTNIVPPTGLPKNGKEALNFFKNFPNLLKQTNNGKGVPLEIDLLSINSMIEIFKIQHICKKVIKEISQSLVQQIENELDNLILKKQMINDLIRECERNDEYLNCKHEEYLKNLKYKIDESEAGFKERVSNVLYDVKSGKKEQNVLSNYFGDYVSSQYSSNGISLILSQKSYKSIEKKINFLQQIKLCSNLKMIKKTQNNLSLFVNSNENINKDIYIFKTDENINQDMSELHDKYWDYFLSLKRTKPQALFYIYDFEIFDEANKAMCILYYSKGKLIDTNCFREHKPFVRRIKQVNMKINQKSRPENSIPLKVKCSNFDCCPRSINEWHCEKCDQKIYYDKKLDFYCDCGSYSYKNFEFKCISPHHPESKFFKFQNLTDLEQYLLKFF